MCIDSDTFKVDCTKVVKNILKNHSDKKVLVLVGRTEAKSEFKRLESPKVTVCSDFELKTSGFDVIIEAPFNDEKYFYQRRTLFNPESSDTYMYSLFTNAKLTAIQEINKFNPFFISITNLLNDNAKIYNDDSSYESADQLLEESTKVERQMKNLDKLEVRKRQKNSSVNFDEIIKKFHLMLKEAEENLLKNDQERISLLTGKRGYCTVKVKALDSKQHEEYLNIC